MPKSVLLNDELTIEEAFNKKRQKVKICSNCIIPDNFRTSKLNDNGQCIYCNQNTITGTNRDTTDEDRHSLSADLNNKLKSIHYKNNLYDVAVGFSGGKDSTYLIWKLKNEFNLNVLGIVIDHSYFPSVVRENINKIAQKLAIDIFYYRIDSIFMNKFFKHKLTLHNNNDENPIFDLVCADCSNIIEGNVMKIAAQLNIPYVLIGLSPEQTNRYFFSLGHDHINQIWMEDFFNQSFIEEKDKKYQWNPQNPNEKKIEVFFPFHVWDYDTEIIKKELSANNLLKACESDPLRTECKILHTIRFLDYCNLGYDPRIGPFSDLVRMGKSDRGIMIENFYDFKFDLPVIEEVHQKLGLYY